ncbi:hypothetical protein ACVWY0_001083 [Arthrobacter sp. UYNi723]
MLDDTWRIDVEVLTDEASAENAAKYWACRAGARGKIAWEHQSSDLFGTVSASEAATLAAEHVVATFIGAACPGCGAIPEGIVVASRAAASTTRSSSTGLRCAACTATQAMEADRHREQVKNWLASFGGPLPDELVTIDEMLLLDRLSQSDPFKDKRLRGALLKKAGFSSNDVGRLFDLGIIYPAAVPQPANIEFLDEHINYRPLEIDWHPFGEGTLDERFESIERLVSEELHGAAEKFPADLETLARKSIVWEAERYLTLQLYDRGIDDPTEAQLTRFRESIVEAWADHSLGEFYYAIWPGCAKAADNKARNPRMGRDAVTGSAVNAIVNTLSEFSSGQRPAKRYTQPYNLPLGSTTVSVFRIALDLDPMSAIEGDVAAVLGTDSRPLPAPEAILEGVRHVYSTCLRSMPEEHAYVAAMVGLDLLVGHYDTETINAARAAFTGGRFSARIPD